VLHLRHATVVVAGLVAERASHLELYLDELDTQCSPGDPCPAASLAESGLHLPAMLVVIAAIVGVRVRLPFEVVRPIELFAAAVVGVIGIRAGLGYGPGVGPAAFAHMVLAAVLAIHRRPRSDAQPQIPRITARRRSASRSRSRPSGSRTVC
jgi:hypothetical protein